MITTSIKYLTATLALVYLLPTPSLAQSTNTPSTPSTPSSVQDRLGADDRLAYREYMRLGYAAAKREDYQTAALYFRSALYTNPRDRKATIAYWNAKDALSKLESDGNEAPSDYDRYMEMGYDATEQEDYQTALSNFQRALQERPGDYYATQAIRNVQTYVNRGEGVDEEISASPAVYPGESPYDRYMRLGYAAEQREDYRAAIKHFRSALYERPNDRQATIAFWNAKDVLRGGTDSSTTEAESNYDRYMRIGYDAVERKNYQTALINFQRALQERPEDYYATQAVRNIQTYIRRGQEGVSRN